MTDHVVTLAKGPEERLRIALQDHRGADLVDLRIAYGPTQPNGALRLSKRGVSIPVHLLPQLLLALQDLQQEAARRGLPAGHAADRDVAEAGLGGR